MVSGKAGSRVTEDVWKYICESLFNDETNNAFKITLANRTEVPLYRQLYIYYKNYFLKYDLDEILIRAGWIYDYAIQDVKKYIFGKAEMDKLNTAESFFSIASGSTKASTSNSGINTTNGVTKNNTNQLNVSRADSTNTSSALGITRSGSSQINEDFKNVEEHWRSEDSKYKQLNTANQRDTFDINVHNINDLNLDTVISKSKSLKLEEAPAALQQIESPEVLYTGINLGKSTTNSKVESLGTNKGLNVNASKVINENKVITTNLGNNTSNSLNFNLVYGDSVYRSLGLYISNCRESFFSSFSNLFEEAWVGYNNY